MKNDLDFCIAFINEIEQTPAIYDHSLPDYSNRRVTEMIWAKIGKKFNETGNDCKAKWKCIRSSYIRSLNAKLKSGSGAGSKKEFYLAPYLRFLNSFTKNRSQEGNISQTQNSTHVFVEDDESENNNVGNLEDINSQDELSSAAGSPSMYTMDEHISSPSPRSPTQPRTPSFSIFRNQSKKSKPDTNIHQYSEAQFSIRSPSPESHIQPHTPSSSIYKTQSKSKPVKSKPVINMDQSREEKLVSISRPPSSIYQNQSKRSKPPLSAVDQCAIDYFSLKKQKIEAKTQAPPSKDSCELFLLSLVPQMQSMTSREQLTFQKGVLNLIENIKYPQPPPILIYSDGSSSTNGTNTTTFYQNFSNEIQQGTSTQQPQQVLETFSQEQLPDVHNP